MVTPMPAPSLDLLKGTLDLLILKTLSWGPAHGYAVARWIEQVTDDVLQVEEGSLYPALHRLEKRGWIGAEWGLSDNNRRAKYYELTAEGRKHLRAESADWSRFADAVFKVLDTAPRPA
jgi:PadR family transcriptional regulator, regulatory protein PadR